MPVLATAGHVDHGKTSLLRYLTAMEPSRLSEEIRRGMTMQLGYVWRQHGDQTVGFVDVPGHSDYTKAMLSGICPVDGFLFVVACDDGFMPQSEEHLLILRSLNICHGVVVLTKTDLVSPQRVAELKEEAQIKFLMAFDDEIPVVTFSSKTPCRQDDLESAYELLVNSLPAAPDLGNPRVLVDRSFSPKGIGTVVTGTLIEGALKPGMELQIAGMSKKSTVKAIHSYGKEVEIARPCARVALNLPQFSLEEVQRGSLLGSQTFLTDKADVRITVQPGSEHEPVRILRPQMVTVINGGRTVRARAIPMGKKFFRLQFEQGEWLRFGDRLILMQSGMDGFIGGAQVVDEAPRRAVSRSRAFLNFYQILDLEEYLHVNLERCGFLDLEETTLRTRWNRAQFLEKVGELEDFGVLGNYIIAPSKLNALVEFYTDLVSKWHLNHPDQLGMPLAKLQQITSLPDGLAQLLVRYLKGKIEFAGAKYAPVKITQSGSALKLIGFERRVTNPTAVLLDQVLQSTEPEMHSVAEMGLKEKKARAQLQRYAHEGKLVLLGDKYFMSRIAFDLQRQKVESFLRAAGPSPVVAIRDHLQLGRKQTILILETLDRLAVTNLREDLARGLI